MMRKQIKLSLAAFVIFGGTLTAANRGGGGGGHSGGGHSSGGRPSGGISGGHASSSMSRPAQSFSSSRPAQSFSSPSQSFQSTSRGTPSVQHYSTPSVQSAPSVSRSVPLSSSQGVTSQSLARGTTVTPNARSTQVTPAQSGLNSTTAYRYQGSPYGGTGVASSGAPVYSRIGAGTGVSSYAYPSTGYYGGYRTGGYYGGYGSRGYGYGYPYGGYGFGFGYGWPYSGFSFGYGYGPFRFAISIPLFGYGYGGYGYGGYGSGYGYPSYSSTYPTTTYSTPLTQPTPVADPQQLPQTQPTDYFTDGQKLIMEGKYPEAIQALRHAAVDMPKSGTVAAVMSQALFANGSFDEAAGAAQQALTLLPENKWVFTLANTGTMVDTKNSMAELRKQIAANPKEPGLRFLAGYQSFVAKDYKQTVAELDELNKLVPDEPIATKLRKVALESIK